MRRKKSMTIGCNIWIICLELNWLFYDPSWMLQLSEFIWTPRSSAWVVFNNFLLKDAIDRSKVSSDQKPSFFAVSLYPLSFFGNTLFKSTYFWSFYASHPHICDLSLYLSTDLWSLLVLHPQICDISFYYINRSTDLWSFLVLHLQICDISFCYIHRSLIFPCITSTDLWYFLVLHPQICDISLYYNQRSYDLILYYIRRPVIFSCILSTDLWYFLVQSTICDLILYYITDLWLLF